jgi:acyl-CoA synthetase (AMP-forming)/AMP-acid ligase II
MNIGSIMTRHAQYRPGHTAVVFEDERLAYEAFNARVNQLANVLIAEGIGKDDKIATVLPNCLELLTLYWAVAKTGAVVVPMSPQWGLRHPDADVLQRSDLHSPSGLPYCRRDQDHQARESHPYHDGPGPDHRAAEPPRGDAGEPC